MAVRTYQELLVWQRGMDLAVIVYQLTDAFPRHELYGLTNQLRRAVVSVPSNIAEGQDVVTVARSHNIFGLHKGRFRKPRRRSRSRFDSAT